MEKYTSTHTVFAKPMKEKQAILLGIQKAPKDYNEDREGYCLYYVSNNGKAFDRWLPKKVFEELYVMERLQQLQTDYEKVNRDIECNLCKERQEDNGVIVVVVMWLIIVVMQAFTLINL